MLQVGSVVRCIAGHDKDRFYVVVGRQGERVLIADGKARKLEKPKAKNPIHLRPTSQVLDLSGAATDKKLRQALRPLNEAAARAEQEGGNMLV